MWKCKLLKNQTRLVKNPVLLVIPPFFLADLHHFENCYFPCMGIVCMLNHLKREEKEERKLPLTLSCYLIFFRNHIGTKPQAHITVVSQLENRKSSFVNHKVVPKFLTSWVSSPCRGKGLSRGLKKRQLIPPYFFTS